jgi:hypothetical protein
MIQAGLFMGLLAMVVDNPPAVEPAALMECRSDMASFQAFAEDALSTAPPAGWTKVEGANPFLTEFRLARPVTAFGRSTSRVAFASSGLLALFDNVEAQAIAGPLGIANDLGGPSKFVGEKILSRKVEEDKELGSRFVTIVALTVSTVDTHPGTVLAGCSYRVDVEDL